MHLRRFLTPIVILLLLSPLVAGLGNAPATALTGQLAATSNVSATTAKTEASSSANSSLNAPGSTSTDAQGSAVGASAALSTKKYVVFRDDDIGFGEDTNALEAVNQVHIDENVPVTLAVVPHPDITLNASVNELLKEPVHSYLKSIQGNPLFEFAQHGYTHQNYVPNATGILAQESEFPGRPYADLPVGQADNRSEFRGRNYTDQYNAIKQGRDDMTEAFGITPTTFIPPFNTGDNNTLKALTALGFTLYSTSPYDFGVNEAYLHGITVQPLTFGIGWAWNDPIWNWRMSNVTQQTDAALDAAKPGDSIVVYYHYWSFENPDGSPNSTHIALLKQYIDHLKSRGDVLFTTLGGQQLLTPSSAPAVCSKDANNLDVFAKGADGVLWHKSFSGTSWSSWQSLGGSPTSSPAATMRDSTTGTVTVFARGQNGSIYYRDGSGTSFGPWTSIGGQVPVNVGPAVCSWGGGRLDVFVQGMNGGMYHRSYTPTSGWAKNWDYLGGKLTSAPAATSRASGGITVFVRGTDGGFWYRDYVGSSWGPWTSIGGQVAVNTGPAACSWGGGRLDVFAEGVNASLYHKSYTPTSGWSKGWDSLGGALTSSPAAATALGTSRIDVFVRGTDNGLWQKTYNNGGWSGWTSIASTFDSMLS